VNAKEDHLNGLKENVIVGHLIPAGTGARAYQKTIVANKDEYQRMMSERLEEQEIDE
jgi:DNA-directed RNA polymerase subunit beta'